MNPRRLTFAVGTTLLTASLSTTVVGCQKKIVNEGPEHPPHVNEGPTPEQEDPSVNEGPEEEAPAEEAPAEETPPDGPNVNTVAPE
jgi:hypothetical protein